MNKLTHLILVSQMLAHLHPYKLSFLTKGKAGERECNVVRRLCTRSGNLSCFCENWSIPLPPQSYNKLGNQKEV